MPNHQPLDGYNPLRENLPRNKFNNARTTRVFTETAQPTDAQVQFDKRLQDLIIKTQSDLTEDNL